MDWIRRKASEAKEWAGNQVRGAYRAASETVSGVRDWAGEKVSQATEAAGELYDGARAGLTSVVDKVTQTASDAYEWGSHQVDRAADAAGDLYNGARAGLSRVGGAAAEAFQNDSSILGPAKYANPLYWGGKGLEYAGKGLKWVGDRADEAVAFYDQEAKSGHHNGFTRGVMGAASGLAGFGGGLADGVGSLAEWAGKVQQGDKKTLQDTASTVRSVGEGVAYLDGKAREGLGTLVEGAGEALDSDLLRRAGGSYADLGRTEQSLASQETRRVVDTFGQAGTHYLARVGEMEGRAVRAAGDLVGSEALRGAGDIVERQSQAVQRRTENGLTRQIDGFVEGRLQEYREHGAYAITRDITRVGGEIASLVVAPEAV
ncbi:MAG TPA: hypothetical protein VNO81_09715, partial [Candidatus Nitrosotenuis sp.]|nr:hypothetical protein [Candidatus Nitrosotenuis sp.]